MSSFVKRQTVYVVNEINGILFCNLKSSFFKHFQFFAYFKNQQEFYANPKKLRRDEK